MAIDEHDVTRAYVVGEDGRTWLSQDFSRYERAAHEVAFGKMTSDLFARIESSGPTDSVLVDILIAADLPEPQLPFDGRDQIVPISAYELWIAEHALAQQERIRVAGARIRNLLAALNADVVFDGRGLPIFRARVNVSDLRLQAFHESDVTLIAIAQPENGALLGHAGHASMLEDQLVGGVCGGACDGGLIDVGIWEADSAAFFTGISRANARIFAPNSTVTGYLHPPLSCAIDTNCPSSADTKRSCRANDPGAGNICVYDHGTWVAASVGMNGSYAYSSTTPPDAIPNVPTGTALPASGAYLVDYRIGNDSSMAGLEYLINPPPGSGPPTPYVNRSQDIVQPYVNWAGRAYGTFVTVAAGNFEGSNVTCTDLKNGMCVGAYSYNTYNDQASHRRTTGIPGGLGSSYINLDPAVERPHILGPGFHSTATGLSGLHMPAIDVAVGSTMMRTADYAGGQIFGTSFAAPAVLGAAILAHQYEGWFSALAQPMVKKAVLMAASVDANGDGAIGKGAAWHPQPSDAEDGAGQLNFSLVKRVLDNNTYASIDLTDASFVSCGKGCREYVAVPSISIPSFTAFQAALAWQTCMTSFTSGQTLNNDLDLVLNCGDPLLQCGATVSSASVVSEVEMVNKPSCSVSKTCSLRIRIKNGAPLASCGSTTYERVGLAWRVR